MFSKKFLITAASALFLAACGNNAFEGLANKNSAAADRDRALAAMDNGDFATAKIILEAQCPANAGGVHVCATDTQTQQLAAAYMGSSGVDMLTLMEELDTAATIDMTTISAALSLSSDPATSAAQLADINSAISSLGAIENPSADQSMQLGLANASAAVISIGSVTGGFDANGLPASCNGDCSAGGLTGLANTTTDPDGNTVTVAEYAAVQVINASNNLNAATGADTSNNTSAQGVNDLTYSMQTGTCNNTAAADYQPASGSVTGDNVTTYLSNCL